MPRKTFARESKRPIASKGEWDAVLADAKAEVARFKEVSRESRLTYERNARTLEQGWDLASAAKGTRYAMKAAGLYVMRRQLRALASEARKVKAKGETGKELQPVVMAQFAQRAKAVREKLEQIAAFEAQPWTDYTGERTRVQRSHKQQAATDAELIRFFAAVPADSEMRLPLLVAEFSGVRGKELAAGVRVELGKADGRLQLAFVIESAKCDGDKKGLDLRALRVSQPSEASPAVQRRWNELARAVGAAGKRLVVKVEPTAKQTVGQRITQACKFASIRAGVHVAAYSLRHRVSAQAKASGDAVSVALVLGHQTTRTQGHYGRRKRGGGGVSPVRVVGVNLGEVSIRGAPKRAGPPPHVKDKAALRTSIPSAPTRRAGGPRL